MTAGRLLKLNKLTIRTQLNWAGALQGCTLEESSLRNEMSSPSQNCALNYSHLALHQCLPQGHCNEFWSRGCVDLLHRHLSLRRHLCEGQAKDQGALTCGVISFTWGCAPSSPCCPCACCGACTIIICCPATPCTPGIPCTPCTLGTPWTPCTGIGTRVCMFGPPGRRTIICC